jgi:hypothetical protein
LRWSCLNGNLATLSSGNITQIWCLPWRSLGAIARMVISWPFYVFCSAAFGRSRRMSKLSPSPGESEYFCGVCT